MNKIYVYKGKKTDAVSFYLRNKLGARSLQFVLESLGFEAYTREHNGEHEVRVSYKRKICRSS